ncbi:hypothetical protein OKA05_00525 [Luteolibacter arcticus]|uniref:Uncharacterized protein n=1 Tax=Luteolibacter arcticus TaxID=1581411 RepID=A0ABT3GBL4_9BACT|nr:hypothetical protein [Luteolibacter arcticus]MCW1921017.1 hypothetical protein [Luteolibacter arcticus]
MQKYAHLGRLALVTVALTETALAGKFDNELEKLQKARDEAVAKATLPIDRKFKAELEALQRKVTSAGDLETALAIKKKIEVLEAAEKGFPLDDSVWKERHRTSTIHFKKGGSYLEEWERGPTKGTWERISTAEIRVMTGGRPTIFVLGEKGDTLTRPSDGLVWDIVKNKDK